MNEALLKKFGLTAESTDEEKKAALAKFCSVHASKMASDAPAEEIENSAKELLEVAQQIEGEDGESMKKLAAKMSHMAKMGAVEEKPAKEAPAKDK